MPITGGARRTRIDRPRLERSSDATPGTGIARSAAACPRAETRGNNQSGTPLSGSPQALARPLYAGRTVPSTASMCHAGCKQRQPARGRPSERKAGTVARMAPSQCFRCMGRMRRGGSSSSGACGARRLRRSSRACRRACAPPPAGGEGASSTRQRRQNGQDLGRDTPLRHRATPCRAPRHRRGAPHKSAPPCAESGPRNPSWRAVIDRSKQAGYMTASRPHADPAKSPLHRGDRPYMTRRP